MSVPKYNEFFPSIIRCLGDGKVHSLKELTEYCAKEFKISDDDKYKSSSSGKNILYDRVGWAKTYLKKAGLITSPKRTYFCLTEEGQKAFQNGADNITLEYLNKFDSFVEFTRKNINHNKISNSTSSNTQETESPHEQIENAINELNNELSDDLMEEIAKISPYEFERLVVKLLIAMGYGTMEENKDAVTSKTGDEGIDGIVSADKFGFDSIYIQAKQWKPDSVVSRPEIQKFLGALAGQGATKGIFITTAQFSKGAVDFVEKQLHTKIVLVNGKQLTKLMIDYDIGVSTVATYRIKRIDSDFFNEGV